MSGYNPNIQQQQQYQQQIGDNSNMLRKVSESHPEHIRKVSLEQLHQTRKISYEIHGQVRKMSQERFSKDPIEIIQLNKKLRNKDQQTILCSFLKGFQNLKIIQNESNFSEKVLQFVEKCTYEKIKKGEFIFHTMDKNDYFYFILKGEVAAYAKKSEKNRNNSPFSQNQHQSLGTQSTQSPFSSQGNNGQILLSKQSSSNQSENNVYNEDEANGLLRISNQKIGQYFEQEGNGRPKYNRIQVYKEQQSFGDLSKKYKTFSSVAKTDTVEVIKIQNKDFTQIFDFLEKKLSLTIGTLRKQFEGIVSDRILINLSYLFEEDGEVLTTGEFVYRDADIIDKIFLVKEGHLDLVKRVKNIKGRYVEKKISILSAGELFGYESLLQIKQNQLNSSKEIQYNHEGDEIKEIVEIKQQHKFSCKSTTENASIYWLDLNMLRRHDDYEEFLTHLAKKGEKKALFYDERLQKMLQVEEKQHSDLQSPSKIKDKKLSFKDAIQGMIERQSSNVFDYGISPSQTSLSNINDELSSPQLQKKKSQIQTIRAALDKVENQIQGYKIQRQSSLLISNSPQRYPSEGYSPDSSPLLKKHQTFNLIPNSFQPSMLFQEMIPERDESPKAENNQLKLSFQRSRNNASMDDIKLKGLLQDKQPYNQQQFNISRGSFSSTYEAGFLLKPLYNSNSNNSNNIKINSMQQQVPLSGLKLTSSAYSLNQIKSISPFSSPIKVRTMRGYNDIQKDSKTIKGMTTEKDNLARKGQQSYKVMKIGQANQIEEQQLDKTNKNLVRISSSDTPQEIEEQLKLQIERKLKRSDSSRLLQRKKENENSFQNPYSMNIQQMDQLLKHKEDIMQNQNIPKHVQLVSGGLPTFEESEKIQRLLKRSNTKVINPHFSMSAINNITGSAQNYSPGQLKKGGQIGNSMNQSINSSSLNISIAKIMKNKKQGLTFGELNESSASYEKMLNNSQSPMKIKSYTKLNILEDEDISNASKTSPNIQNQRFHLSRNSSHLSNLNGREQDEQEYEDDSSSNIFKFTCESPKLKLQLRQAAADPSLSSNTMISLNNNMNRIHPQQQESQEELQNQSEIQDTIITLGYKSSLSKAKSTIKSVEENNSENAYQQNTSLTQLPQIKDDRSMKSIQARLQEATGASPHKNTNLMNDKLYGKRFSLVEENNTQKNNNYNYNLFPSFQSKRNSIQTITNCNAETQPSRNTRSSSISQNLVKETTPLILKPNPSESEQNAINDSNLNSKGSSRVTLQTGERKKRNSQLTFNQSLLKKSLIRQSLHKKYQQVVSSSPYRDKVIVVGETNILNEELSHTQSHIISATINGHTVSDNTASAIKSQRFKLKDANTHFLMDSKNIFPISLENSRIISSSLLQSNGDKKQSTQNINLFHGLKPQQQLPKTLVQTSRYNSVERLSNINSLHQMYTPDKLEQSLNNKRNVNIKLFNSQSVAASPTNTPDKIHHLAPLSQPTNSLTPLPARQAALQNLYTLISTQKKQEISFIKNPSLVSAITNRNTQIYSNITKILQPVQLKDIKSSEKKGFSLHSNS